MGGYVGSERVIATMCTIMSLADDVGSSTCFVTVT